MMGAALLRARLRRVRPPSATAVVACAAAAATATGSAALAVPEEEMGESWRPPPVIYGNRTAEGRREYRARRRLGAGVDGVAFQYEDQTNMKNVAIKFPKVHAAVSEREAFAVARRINPNRTYRNNLPPAYELLELDSSAGVASGMATVWGWGGESTLHEAMQQGLTVEDANEFLACLLKALRRLHAENHIHGDLHTQNAMLHHGRMGATVRAPRPPLAWPGRCPGCCFFNDTQTQAPPCAAATALTRAALLPGR